MAIFDGHIFSDRREAGRKLAQELVKHEFKNPVILGLARGGVILAHEVGLALGAPVSVAIVRKIGAPGHEEYGIGAMSEDEKIIFNPEILSYYDLRSPEAQKIVEDERIELRRRIKLYRGGKALPEMTGKTAILIDDGLATGVTAAAAGKFVRTLGPSEVILAVPVCPGQLDRFVQENFDEIICLHSLPHFRAIGCWYENFTQVEDVEVLSILHGPSEAELRW